MSAIISLSGGMDSGTLLGDSIDRGKKIEMAVSFGYGSKHESHELVAAYALAGHYGVPIKRINIARVLQDFRSALLKTGDDIPEGYYEGENMRQTVVPGRNMIFTAILAGLAESVGASEVLLGVHAGDHFIYPDCRPEFVIACARAVAFSSDGKVHLTTPYLDGNKETIIRRGVEIGVPYSLTRTCYKDQPIACGRCGSCQERLDAFAKVGITDPIAYETRDLIPKQ